MVPLSLRLRNFMSYGLEGGELDLRPIHLACLSGKNGHGKSTLVDAMTWALWGRSRAAREDDLLRQGTTEMEVEFEFAGGGSVYRVIRKRVQRKTSSQAVLELAVLDGGVYRAITGATIAETERAIAELLHLSYETFINSSLLLQGQDDLFTLKRPGERKEVLAEILGLQRYEELAERARERERRFRSDAEVLSLRIEDLDRFIGALPQAQEQRAAVEADLSATAEGRAREEGQVADLEAQVRGLANLQESLRRIGERLGQIERAEGEQRRIRDAATAKIERADALLADEPAIRASLIDLQDARQQNDRLGSMLAVLRDLERRQGELHQVVAREEERLRGEHRRLQQAIAAARTSATSLAARRVELARVQGEQVHLPTLEARRQELAAQERALLEESSSLQATDKALDAQRKEWRKKIESLRAAGALCPVCNTPLDEAHRERLHAEAMAAGLACKQQMEVHGARLLALARDGEALRREQQAVEAEIAHVQALGRRGAALEQEVATLAVGAEALDALLADEVRLVALLEGDLFALEQRQALQSLHLEVLALGYDVEAHQRVQARIRELGPAETRRAALDTARDERRQAEAERSGCELRLVALSEERARLLEERQPLLDVTSGLSAVQASLETHRRTLHEIREQERGLQQRLGSLQRQIEDGQARLVEREAAVREREAAERQAWAHRELNAIFGKRGIQAMLIENALPELEADTNDMLARMTDNSTQVTFVTRREGKAGNAIETLDIKIADNMGTRTYEMFSGGEAFRINFAIRIALSKLLARRAGAELSFLLVDEGFGSQDTEGRDRLVEAINAIADDFQKILVVTHIEELKDRFDVHIEVSKGLGGSQIIVSAA